MQDYTIPIMQTDIKFLVCNCMDAHGAAVGTSLLNNGCIQMIQQVASYREITLHMYSEKATADIMYSHTLDVVIIIIKINHLNG